MPAEKTNYIGLATSPHDPAIAIVNASGEVVFAEAAERCLQNKRAWHARPDDMIRARKLLQTYCDPEARLVAAQSWSRKAAPGYTFLLKVLYPALELFGWKIPMGWKAFLTGHRSILLAAGGNLYDQRIIDSDRRTVEFRGFDHHLTHAFTACASSGLPSAACAVVDGVGERTTIRLFVYRDGKVEPLATPRSEWASLGLYYGALCEACGFSQINGEEWKVMGLAAYGSLDQEIRDILRSFYRIKNASLQFAPGKKFEHLIGVLNRISSSFNKDDPLRAANLAHAGQEVFCELLFEILNELHRMTGERNLVFSGGCALNSAANGRILKNTPFETLHVYSAPADDGNAIGAALLAFQADHPDWRPPREAMTPYLGSEVDLSTLEKMETFGGLKNIAKSREHAQELAIEFLFRGKIIGWINGRAEFGPRALGNRSILADPRDPQIKDRLNSRVKFREQFRPFAPAILEEHAAEYFQDYAPAPYMERALKFSPDAAKMVPGVVHVDGTGRLQTVRKDWNPEFHGLISAFHEKTGVPLLLNTSFNVMGKPIVHSVEDAIAVFFTSGLDALFIEGRCYSKNGEN